MREKLLPHLGKRLSVSATFTGQVRLRGGGRFPATRMVLLKDVKLHGEIITDHVWINCGKRFDPAAFKAGDVVCFKVKVIEYEKGYLGRGKDGIEGVREPDLKLAYPSDVRGISQPEQGQTTIESTLTT